MFSNKKLLSLGVLAGLIAPIVALWFFYYFRFYATDFDVFVKRLIYSTLFGPVLSLCVLVNLGLFFSFIWLDKDEASWGVLFITILYAFIVFGFKIFN